MKSSALYIKVGNSQIAWSDGSNKFSHEDLSSFSFTRWQQRLKNKKSLIAFGVVPKVLKKFQNLCRENKVSYRELKLSDIPTRPAYTKGIGIDRVLNAWGAFRLLKSPCVVIDFGTAVTAEFINKSGNHLGGFIVIGPRLALNSLHRGTALIPELKNLKSEKKRRPGTSSSECLSQGHLLLYRGFISEIKALAQKTLGSRYKIVLTGGAGEIFATRQMRYVKELGLSSLIHLRLQ